jgi:hypothetical protein
LALMHIVHHWNIAIIAQFHIEIILLSDHGCTSLTRGQYNSQNWEFK